MSANKITYWTLREDLNTERLRAKKQLAKLERNIDFQKVVGEVFDAQGYVYTIDPNGNFIITGEVGMTIIGKWNGICWDLLMNTRHSGEDSGNYKLGLQLSPAAFDDYVPLFDSMLAKLKKLYNKYEASAKAHKSGQLLKLLLPDALKQSELTDIVIIPDSKKKDLLQLGKHITGNLYLTTTIDFSNYKERCNELKLALDNLPSIVEDTNQNTIYYRSKGTRWSESKRQKIEHPILGNGEELKMRYDTDYEPKHVKLDYDPEIVECLKKLGYRYLVSSNDELRILISSGTYLSRLEQKCWFSGSNRRSLSLEISKEYFLQLLHYIALASIEKGRFWIYFNTDFGQRTTFYDCIAPILKVCLPGDSFIPVQDYYPHNYCIKIICDSDAKNGFKWRTDNKTWLNTLFYVINNYEAIKTLPLTLEKAENPNVKIYIKQMPDD